MSTTIIGHQEKRDKLRELILADKLAHALLLTGPSGIGKKLVATEVAATLLCEQHKTGIKKLLLGGCGTCPACKNFKAGNHPDFYLADCRQRDRWNTKEVRELLYSLHLKSFSSGARVVIFDNAEDLPTQAANALLKTLEEPRPQTYMILVCSTRSKLPATIVSRCQVWFFEQLKSADLKLGLKSRPELPNSDSTLALELGQDIFELAQGSFDKLDTVLRYREWWEGAKPLIERTVAGDAVTAVNFLKNLAQDKETLRPKLDLVRTWVHQRMRSTSEDLFRTKLSLVLSNLVEAERLIFDRNIGAAYVLNSAILPLLDPSSADLFLSFPRDNFLIEDYIT